MALADYVSEDAVCMGLGGVKRDEAMRVLVERLAECGSLPAKLVKKAMKALIAREALGSTAIGRGVAVPHARLAGVAGIVMAFGHSRQGRRDFRWSRWS